MCRLLLVKSHELFDSDYYLQLFSDIAKNSPEYQGDGWGVAWMENNKWKIYKSVKPIWTETYDKIPQTSYLMAHARSAFNETGSDINYTMPFKNSNSVYIFNGEIRDVRLNISGVSGAEKLYNLILRLDDSNFSQSIPRALSILKKRSRYIRASNIIIATYERAYISSYFSENPEYFTLFKKNDRKKTIVCSTPLKIEGSWNKIPNNSVEVF